MNLLRSISIKNLMSLPGIIIILFITIAALGLLIDSQTLASQVDLKNIYLAPFENPNFLLGTDGLGRSVAYGLINGIKISLFIAILTAVVSLIISLFFCYLAGYLGNDKLFLSLPTTIIGILVSLLSLFYFWHTPSIFIFIGWLITCFSLLIIDRKIFHQFNKSPLPLDSIIMKYVAIQKSLPGIFLILFIFALTSERSLLNVIAIISFARIPALIRLSRSEVLKVKNQVFIIAAEAMGLKSIQIFIKHILPNIFTPLKTYMIYTMATTILIESTLSFLGLGLSIDTVTLGSMLGSSRDYFSAWWLAILPGIVIFLLIYSIRKLLNQKVDTTDYAYL